MEQIKQKLNITNITCISIKEPEDYKKTYFEKDTLLYKSFVENQVKEELAGEAKKYVKLSEVENDGIKTIIGTLILQEKER